MVLQGALEVLCIQLVCASLPVLLTRTLGPNVCGLLWAEDYFCVRVWLSPRSDALLRTGCII